MVRVGISRRSAVIVIRSHPPSFLQNKGQPYQLDLVRQNFLRQSSIFWGENRLTVKPLCSNLIPLPPESPPAQTAATLVDRLTVRLARVLAHPERILILAALNRHDLSPRM